MTDRPILLKGGAHRLADGIIEYKGMAWTAARARKATECWLTRKPINPGDAIYRPLSNGKERMRRVLASAWAVK